MRHLARKSPSEIRRWLMSKREVASLRDYLQIKRMMQKRKSPAGRSVVIRLRPLGNLPVVLRSGTSDADVVWDTFVGLYHLPPDQINAHPVRVIWDLGSNIGLTVAHFAGIFPHARVRGVELDGETAEIARRNIAGWGERCSIVTGAVWVDDGEIQYELLPGEEYGARVTQVVNNLSPRRASSYSLNTLMADDAVVDFVKMDIEGAEREVLRGPSEWASRVRSIKVEVHEPYTVKECELDLQALGFSTWIDDRHWACVVGIRDR